MILLIIQLALVGCVCYLITRFIPMPEAVKIVIYVVVAICMIYFLMHAFGIVDVPVPQVGGHR